MLRCLSADQSCACLQAAFCHTFDNICDLLRLILPTCNIIQEEERLSSCARNIINAHRNRIDPDRIMLFHDHCQFHFSAASVCTGQKDRLLHLLNLSKGKRSGKSAEPAEHFRTHRLFHMLFHQFHRSVTGLDINACFLIIHSLFSC